MNNQSWNCNIPWRETNLSIGTFAQTMVIFHLTIEESPAICQNPVCNEPPLYFCASIPVRQFELPNNFLNYCAKPEIYNKIYIPQYDRNSQVQNNYASLLLLYFRQMALSSVGTHLDHQSATLNELPKVKVLTIRWVRLIKCLNIKLNSIFLKLNSKRHRRGKFADYVAVLLNENERVKIS